MLQILKIIGLSGTLGFILTMQAKAHEFWIWPEQWNVESGQDTSISLKIGERFKGLSLYYLPQDIEQFDHISPNKITPIKGRLGDMPAGKITPDENGIHIIRHETKDKVITYQALEKFKSFAEKKGYPEAGQRHLDRDLPEEKFKEIYRRYAKSIITVGSCQGGDRRLGMAVEITAVTKPCDGDGMMVLQFDRQGSPWADAFVTTFARPLEGEAENVKVTHHKTDADGRLQITTKTGYIYLVDAVSLDAINPSPATSGAVWQTRWASLTFATNQK